MPSRQVYKRPVTKPAKTKPKPPRAKLSKKPANASEPAPAYPRELARFATRCVALRAPRFEELPEAWRKPKPQKIASRAIQCENEYVTLTNDSGYSVEGVRTTCSECDYCVESFGASSRSVARNRYLLKEECPEADDEGLVDGYRHWHVGSTGDNDNDYEDLSLNALNVPANLAFGAPVDLHDPANLGTGACA
jgi:hypothetical protein